uniref:F-box domain-containing protein n=1 Tax=Moniliophthora roreri TaxID=221103 RepID=A0A0W0FNX4_MONRR
MPQSRSGCILPPELIANIVGFASNTTKVAPIADEDDERLDTRQIRSLSALSLVSQTWLHACRRNFRHCRFVFDFNRPQSISKFLDLLRGRDDLPNLPHILSFLLRIKVQFCVASPDTSYYPQHIFIFLHELSKRKDFFRPIEFDVCNGGIVLESLYHRVAEQQMLYHPNLIPALSQTFRTTTRLTYGEFFAECFSNLVHFICSFENLEEVDLKCRFARWLANDSLRIYRIPQNLRTLHFDIKCFCDNSRGIFIDWLQSHPPLPNMRHLSFLSTSQSHRAVTQALLNVCPQLDTLLISFAVEDAQPGDVIDLTSQKQLRRLCFQVPPFDYSDREHAMDTVLRIVRTATPSLDCLELRLDASSFCEETMQHWKTCGTAVFALSQYVVMKLRIVYRENPQGMGGNDIREDVIRRFQKLFVDPSIHSRILVCTEKIGEWWYLKQEWKYFVDPHQHIS